MSSYPRPTETNIFNPIDYEHEPSEEEQNDNNDEYHDDSDHLLFVLKTGGHMTGALTVPQLSFTNNTSQTSAFTHEMLTELETNTTQIDILSNSIIAIDTKVNNITQNDITLKNVVADSFTSSGVSTLAQISFSLDNTIQTSAFTHEMKTELETATTQIDVLSNSIVAVDTKVNNITQNDITLKNVLADSFTSPGVSTLAQIESLGVSTSNLSVSETSFFDKNVVCADLYCRNYSNGEQSRFGTVNNWLYIQNNERIVFDQIANGVDPNVEINTSTGELKCESLIVQNNLNVSSPSLTVNGGLQINDNNASLIFEGSTGCYIEGKNTTRGRDWWMGVSGGDDITPNNFNITTLHGVDILLYPSGGGKVLCEGPLVGNSYIQADRNGEAIKMKGNHNYITGNNLNDERMFYIGTPNIDSNVLHIANTAVDGDINIKTTGSGKILLNSGDISNIVQDIEHLKEDVDIALIQNNSNAANVLTVVPVGTIFTTARPPTLAPPNGYLYCDGLLVSKTTYSELWDMIGNTYAYNKPLYNEHFYVPDMRQLYVRGGQMNTTYPVDAQPVAMGTYQSQSIQKHSHDYQKPYLTADVTNYGVSARKTVYDNVSTTLKTESLYDDNNNEIPNINAETRPESIVLNYMIKY